MSKANLDQTLAVRRSVASRKNPEDSPEESVTVFSDFLSDLLCGEAANEKREIAPFLPASEASGALPLSPPSPSVPLGEADLLPRSGSRRSHLKNKKNKKARAKRDAKKKNEKKNT